MSYLANRYTNNANLRDLIAATGLVILLKLDSNRCFFTRVTLKFDGWPKKIIGHLFYTTLSFVHHLKSIGEFKLELQSGNVQFGSKLVIFVPCDLEIRWMTWETIGHHFYIVSSFVRHFRAMDEFKLELQSGNPQFKPKSVIFLFRVTLKFEWPWKTIGHLFCVASSFVQHHFIAISVFKLESQTWNAKFGWKAMVFVPCDIEIWHMTLKNNRATLLCYFKLCASFRSHWWIKTGVAVWKCLIGSKSMFLLEPCDLEIWWMTLKNNRAPLLSTIKLYISYHHHHMYTWIQTGVIVRKRLSWVLTSVTLTFDLWPWPFAWTSLLSMLITPENFMIRWWEHSVKGVTDGQTDGQTDRQTDGLNHS